MGKLDRRRLLFNGCSSAAGVGALTMAATAAGPAVATQQPNTKTPAGGPARAPDKATALVPKLRPGQDNTRVLQAALEQGGTTGQSIVLPPGTFKTGPLQIAPGTHLTGSPATTLVFTGGKSLFNCTGRAEPTTQPTQQAHRQTRTTRIENLHIDMAYAGDTAMTANLVDGIELHQLHLSGANQAGILLTQCTGSITQCDLADMANAGIFAIDSTGLDIVANRLTRIGNNAIQIWRSEVGHDGSCVADNRIESVTALAGGTGQNGNGINVFRANGVQVTGNHIADCTYSAIRGNAASNIMISTNTCQRLGEVAIYTEFGFDGAVITSNIIDTAATGIVVTNFNVGGRLATVQGNVVRNLFRRENEPFDKRGVGISIEADTAVSGNTIENAATVGIAVGHHQHMRDCAVTGNVIRSSSAGIFVSSDPTAGACLIANNMISATPVGAIRGHNGTAPIGPDLASKSTRTARLAITGNLAV
ncbi:MAG: TIGR03808 family TAT-translocated repetitive protein [Pseudomonadota bacterium]